MKTAVAATRARPVQPVRLGRPRPTGSATSRRTSPTRRPRTTSTASSRELEAKHGLGGNRVYYLAIPPQAFETSVREIGERQDHEGWTRVIVEKPFGHDAVSAHRS